MSPTTLRLLRAIHSFMLEHGYSPTIRELVPLINVRSTCSVSYHLKWLQQAGMIHRPDNHSARTITITELGAQAIADPSKAVLALRVANPPRRRIGRKDKRRLVVGNEIRGTGKELLKYLDERADNDA